MFWDVLIGGVQALKEYVALHVLTCLVPAFLLAGAMALVIAFAFFTKTKEDINGWIKEESS